MIEDFTKLLVYGYMGLEYEKQLTQQREEQIQAFKKNIIIVYDGKSPYTAAQNLMKLTTAMGYEPLIVDSGHYLSLQAESREPLENFMKVVMIGHHELAQMYLNRVELKYDHYGLQIGTRGLLSVLTASQAAVKRSEKDRQAFAEYYSERMATYGEIIKSFAVPGMLGMRRRIIESQYDLLWLEFAMCFLPILSHGLSDKHTS